MTFWHGQLALDRRMPLLCRATAGATCVQGVQRLPHRWSAVPLAESVRPGVPCCAPARPMCRGPSNTRFDPATTSWPFCGFEIDQLRSVAAVANRSPFSVIAKWAL
jgi:hypothetical protein